MKPVNLIPTEQRRSARADGTGGGVPTRVTVLLAGLGFAFVAVLALVLISNQVSSKTDELAEVTKKQQVATAASTALRPYGEFIKVQQERQATVTALENSRFNWERIVRQLSRVIAPGVWVSQFTGTVSSSTGGAAGTGGSGLRAGIAGPAIELKGCSPSQETVARMMARMRNIDGATEVVVPHSEKGSDEGGAATSDAGEGGEGCPKGYYDFDLVVGLDGGGDAAAAATGATAAPAAAATPAPATGATGASGSTGATGTTGTTGGTQ